MTEIKMTEEISDVDIMRQWDDSVSFRLWFFLASALALVIFYAFIKSYPPKLDIWTEVECRMPTSPISHVGEVVYQEDEYLVVSWYTIILPDGKDPETYAFHLDDCIIGTGVEIDYKRKIRFRKEFDVENF